MKLEITFARFYLFQKAKAFWTRSLRDFPPRALALEPLPILPLSVSSFSNIMAVRLTLPVGINFCPIGDLSSLEFSVGVAVGGERKT